MKDYLCYKCSQPASRAVHCDKCGGALFACVVHGDAAYDFALMAHIKFSRDEIVFVVHPDNLFEISRLVGNRAQVTTEPKAGAHNIRYMGRPS